MTDQELARLKQMLEGSVKNASFAEVNKKAAYAGKRREGRPRG